MVPGTPKPRSRRIADSGPGSAKGGQTGCRPGDRCPPLLGRAPKLGANIQAKSGVGVVALVQLS